MREHWRCKTCAYLVSGCCDKMDYAGDPEQEEPGTFAHARDSEDYSACVVILDPERMGCTMWEQAPESHEVNESAVPEVGEIYYARLGGDNDS